MTALAQNIKRVAKRLPEFHWLRELYRFILRYRIVENEAAGRKITSSDYPLQGPECLSGVM